MALMAAMGTALSPLGSAAATIPGDGASGDLLQELVITARKREEPLGRVPVSVTVVSGAELDQIHGSTLADVTNAGPNMVFHTVGEFGHSSSLSMRGVGGGGANFDADPAVAIYVDGQYQTANSINLESLVGIESIEVLRGPQGTLFGRNAFAGAINVTTKNPTGQRDAETTVTVGNTGRKDLKAAADFAPTATVAGRVDLGWINSDGFYRNTLDGGAALGGDANLTIRPTIVWKPGEGFQLQFKYSFIDDQSDPTPNKYDLDPPAGEFGVLNPTQYANWGSTHLGAAGTGGPYSMGFTDICKCNFIKIHAPTLKLDDETALGRLTAITGWQRIDAAVQTDATGTAVPLLREVLPYTIRAFTQEVHLQSQVRDRFKMMTGLYFLHDALHESNLAYIVLGGPPSTTWKESIQRRSSAAAFAEGEYTVAENLRLTAGARYTRETKDFRFGAPVPADEAPGVATPGVATPGAPALQASYPLTPLHAGWRNVSPKVSLDYQWTPETMVYASWSRGFKAGGFQGLASDAAGAGPYGDEVVDASEVGVKSMAWQRRLRLSADVFYEHIRGLQRGVVLLQNGISNNLTVNAADSISKGAEFEAAFVPADTLTIDAGVGYLNAYYSRFCANFVSTNAAQPSCGDQPGEVDNTNLSVSNAPRWTAHLGGDYRTGLWKAGSLRLHVDQSYVASLWTADDNNPVSLRRPQALLNGALTWTSNQQPYFLSLWARNLTDRVVTEAGVLANPLFSLWNPTPPRTYGITWGVQFQRFPGS
jgi:iron complex outermembrane receptor protein